MRKMLITFLAFGVIFLLSSTKFVDAAVNGTTASFTVRDLGFTPYSIDDSDNGSGFYGWVNGDAATFKSEHFFEFDISALDSSSNALLGIDLKNNTVSNPTYGISHDVTLAYYLGTGVTDGSLYGTGSFLQTLTLPNTGINNYNIDVTSIFSGFKSAGYDYLGFRLHDSVWSSTPSVGNQLQYVDSTLTTTVVPEPVSTTLFVVGGLVFGGRSFIRRKRKNN